MTYTCTSRSTHLQAEELNEPLVHPFDFMYLSWHNYGCAQVIQSVAD